MRTVYVIRDKVSLQCSPLFLCPNDESAIREFNQFLSNMTISWTDFELYALALFEPDTCELCDIDGGRRLVYTGRECEEEKLSKLKVEEKYHGE